MTRLATPAARMVMTAAEMQADRAAWLRARRFREGVGYCIGSSDTPSILGVPKTGSPAKVWFDKVHNVGQPDNEAMFWGRVWEDPIAKVWRDRNRSAIRNVGLISNVDQPWQQTSLDRMVLECPLDRSMRQRCALEVKNRNAFGIKRYHADLPDDILCQVCHQLFVTGFDHIHYAILAGGSDFRQGVVRRTEDAATISYVIDKVNEFRDRYLVVGAEVEPEVDAAEHADALIALDGLLHPDRVGEVDVAEVGWLMELAEVRARKAELTRQEKRLKAELLRLANGSRYVTFDGRPAYTFDPRNKSNTDLDRLKEEFPDAYAACVTHSTSWQLSIASAFKPSTAPNDPEE